MVERVAEMADAVVRHLQRLASRRDPSERPLVVRRSHTKKLNVVGMRCSARADEVVRHLQRVASRRDPSERPLVVQHPQSRSTCPPMQVPTREQLLAGITYFRARDYLEQVRSHHVHHVRHATV